MNSFSKSIASLLLTASLMLTASCSNGGTSESDPQVTEIIPAEPLLFAGSSAESSELYVEAIGGMSDSFIRGADVSSYMSEIESGVVYKDFDGNELDELGFFTLLAECGVNCIRVRVWNDPADSQGATYGGGHNDLDTAVYIGQLATRAGMQVLVDFHYSDFWADPSKQMAPKAWAHMTYEDKKTAFSEFTAQSMETLLDAGINVTMVQVGNEINYGIAGETDRTNINELLSLGSAAVREAAQAHDKDIKIVLHYTNALESGVLEIAQDLQTQNVDYDIFAVSFYTFWHGTPEQLTERLITISETYGKDVMVAETSYLYTDDDGDGFANSVSTGSAGVALDYDISVQGQVNEVCAIMQAVKNVGDAGVGVFYWEPAWIPVQYYDPSLENADSILENNRKLWEEKGSGWAASAAKTYDPADAGAYYGGSSWDNQAMFDFEGNPLESLKVFRYVFGGTDAELTTIRVEDISVESGIGQPVSLPETVPALLNSGATKDIAVQWNEEQLAAIDPDTAGIYSISGKAADGEKEYDINCELEIKKINYVKNPGFEETDMSMWVIDGNGIGRENDNNKRSGDYSLKFWDSEAVIYTVEQEITALPAGTYELGAWLQGGDAGSSAVFELYVTVNGETSSASSGVTSWQNWDNPVISGISVPEGASVIVGVRCEAAANAWGAWDDFYLYEE